MTRNTHQEKRKIRWFPSLLLLLIFSASTFSGFSLNKELKDSPEHRIQVTFKTKPDSLEHTTWIQGMQSRHIIRLLNRISKRGLIVENLAIQGVLLIDVPETYFFALSANYSARLLIDGRESGKSSIVQRDQNRFSQTYLAQGMHNFLLEFKPASRGGFLGLLWTSNLDQNFSSIPVHALFAPKTSEYTYQRLVRIRDDTKRLMFFKKTAVLLAGLSLFGWAFVLLTPLSRPEAPIPPSSNILKFVPSPRLSEIDKTKGLAGFLMIAAHLDGANLLAFGTFGAALFFVCSGMNTILFLDKTRNKKKFDPYHLFFVALLFVGGYTQIVIAHPSETRLIPEFLQVSALAMLLIFGLSKLFKNIYYVGYLFWLPYLLHFLIQHGREPIQLGGATHIKSFFFATGAFPLFPWGGFFLYGILLLYLRRKKWARLYLIVVTGLLSILSVFVFGIPINKFDMTLSYVAISLFAATLLFYAFCFLSEHPSGQRLKVIQSVLEVVGRNSLMFVYVHYLAMELIKLGNLFVYPPWELLFSSLLAFLFSAFLVLTYEKIKYQTALFVPAALMFLVLLALKYSHSLAVTADLKMIDILVGVLFAYLYVELRQKLRPAKP